MTISWADRIRALGWFSFAVLYFVFAVILSQHAARGLVSADLYELVSRTILLFLLLVGYTLMGRVGQGQREPLRAMGLAARPGWRSELALGGVLGWAGMVACVLPIALVGELAVKVDVRSPQLVLLLVDFAALAVASLAEEVAFRGYPFQRLIDAMGPFFATLLMSIIFMAGHLQNPGHTSASLATTLLAGWLMALAYLRTRALWVSWGFHLGWNASMGLLFGLPVSGLTVFSPVISSYTRGPVWLTGGGYGPEGSGVAILVLCALLPALIRSTRELKHRFADPVIVPGGIPVDIDALMRRGHEQGMGVSVPAAGAQLVQILTLSPGQQQPATPLSAMPPADEETSHG